MKHLIIAASLLGALVAQPTLAQAPASTAPPTSKRAAAEAWSEDGLQKTSIKGIDVAFARPGTSLAPYHKVLLRPVTVSFRRDWGRSGAGGAARVRPQDAQRIRESLSKLVREETIGELAAGGYAVVTQPGDDVLEIEGSIINLYLVAPDVPGAEATRVYAMSAGEMTLVADLRDSVSGETVLRVYDHTEATDVGRMRRISRVENTAEARRAAKTWASLLRRQLDSARAARAHGK